MTDKVQYRHIQNLAKKRLRRKLKQQEIKQRIRAFKEQQRQAAERSE